MDLSPKVFRDVQFRQKPRGGYHPEDVDEFLEQAALAAEAVLDKLRQANDRADRAEHLAADATSTDDALKRVLILAQRTADQAVKEAYDEAESVVSEARSKAEAILADAEERGRASYETAVNERRETMESADAALQQAREQVEALQGWVDLHRAHLLGVMREAQAVIENAGLVSEAPVVVPVASTWLARAGTGTEGQPAADEPARLGHRQEDVGKWDPHYLDNLDETAPGEPPHPALNPFGHGGASTEGGGASTEGAGPEAVEGAGPEQDQPGTEAPAQHASADPTLAFDESALDNFFSDQDLGDDRGLGRFRRRQ